MAIRIAGTAFVMVNGSQVPVRGDLTISPNAVERNMLAGQDGIHGFQELPRVPWIECAISTTPEVSIEELERQTDVTVVAQTASNWQYTLSRAICKAGIEANTRDGQMTVRWEGLFCEEMQL